MRKHLFFLLFAVLFTTVASAQMVCGCDIKMDELKAQNPEYVKQLEQTESYIRNYIATHLQNTKRKSATYIIPVVVHVMHTGGAVDTK